jgi:hypothetical protein
LGFFITPKVEGMTTHSDYSRDSYPANKNVLKKLKGVRGHLLCRIYWASNLKDGVCRMGLTRLGDEIGFERSTISKAAKALMGDGYIKQVKPADPATGQPAHYQVTQKFYDLLTTSQPVDVINTPVDKVNTPVDVINKDIETNIDNREEEPSSQKSKSNEQLQHKELAIKAAQLLGIDKLPIKAQVNTLNAFTRWLVSVEATPANIDTFSVWWYAWAKTPPGVNQVKQRWVEALAQAGPVMPKSNIVPMPGVAEAIARIEAKNGQ